MTALELEGVQLRRGLILLTLQSGFPHAIAMGLLQRAVGHLYMRGSKELTQDLAYLEAKKLLERDTKEIDGIEYSSFTLTPAGVDLAMGATSDPGIHIERGQRV